MSTVSGEGNTRDHSRRRPANVEEEHKQLHESDEEMFSQLDSTVFKRFFYYSRPHRRKMLIALIAVIGFTLANLATPLMVKIGIDSAITTGDTELLAIIGVAMLANAVLYWVSMYFQRVLISEAALEVLYDIRADMFLQLQRLALSFSDKTPIGSLMARMFGDVGALQEMLESSIEVIGDVLTLVGIIVIMLILDFKLGLIALATMPLLLIIRFVWQPFARRAFLVMRRNSSIVGVYLDQNVSGIRVVQAMNRQPENHGVMNGKVVMFFWSAVRAARLGGILMPSVELLTGIALAVVIVMGGARVLDGTLEVGVMIAFLLYVQRFFEPIRTLTMHYAVLQRAVASGHRIFELLDIPVEIKDKPDAKPIGDIDGRVEFKNVTFGYDPERPVLRDINLEIEPGQTVAIVGPTGSGKTSLTALTHRFYDVQQGSVLIDGVDIKDVTQESIGRVMGMVLQEPFLFSKSILENVLYNTPGATEEDAIRACKVIGAHEFIAELADGYETVLEQRGSNLSVGQRQLLSFARALVADPKILVLDEATANIDSYTEQVVQEALQRLLANRTAMVIAHRLSTIRNADQIVVVEAGQIIEKGTHDELLASDGLYARLWSTTYSSFDDIADNVDTLIGNPQTAT